MMTKEEIDTFVLAHPNEVAGLINQIKLRDEMIEKLEEKLVEAERRYNCTIKRDNKLINLYAGNLAIAVEALKQCERLTVMDTSGIAREALDAIKEPLDPYSAGDILPASLMSTKAR